MTDKIPRKLLPGQGGFIQDIGLRLKLIWRLMGDRRVSIFLKAIPTGSLIYLIAPDLLPGPIDDALVIWLCFYLFIELCPPDVVAEHMKKLRGVISTEWRDPAPNSEPTVIDGEFRDVTGGPGPTSEGNQTNT
jgi:hypothetical protein